MYRLFFIFFTVALLVLFGCQLDKSLDEVIMEDKVEIGEEVICSSQDSLYFTGLLNGKKVWRSKTHSFFYRYQFDRFVVALGGNDGDSRELFMDGGTLNLVTKADTQDKKTPIDAFFVFLYGDVTSQFYRIPERDSARNWIEISYIDSDNQIVEGTFEVFLKKPDDFETSRAEPDSIEILNGCFRLAREK